MPYEKLLNPVREHLDYGEIEKSTQFSIPDEWIHEQAIQLIDSLGFDSSDVLIRCIQEFDGEIYTVHIQVANGLFDDVPFLSGGRIVALLQHFVEKLPDRYQTLKIDWMFEPANVIQESRKILNRAKLDIDSEKIALIISEGMEAGEYKNIAQGIWKQLGVTSAPEEYLGYQDNVYMVDPGLCECVVKNLQDLGYTVPFSSDFCDPKKGSIKKQAAVDPRDTKLLQSGVGRMGKWVMKHPGAIDAMAAVWVTSYLADKLNKQVEADQMNRLEKVWRGY